MSKKHKKNKSKQPKSQIENSVEDSTIAEHTSEYQDNSNARA